MDRERLTELLQDPSRAAATDMADLRTMAERFPWFSGAQLLLAVSRHGSGDVLAHDRHGDPVAYLPSRAVLYDLVQQEVREEQPKMSVVRDNAAPIATSPSPSAEASASVLPEDQAEVPSPTASVAPVLPPESAPPDVDFETETVVLPTLDEPTIGDQVGPGEVPPALELPVPDAPSAEVCPKENTLELQIQEAIRSSGYDIGRYSASASTPEEEISAEPQVVHSEVPETPTLLVSAVELPEATAAEAGSREFPAGARLKFTDWLAYEAPAQTAEIPAEKLPLSALSVELPVKTPVPKTPALSASELLEQFIQQAAPVAPKQKVAFFNPQQAAKKSLEDQGLVSETLARILEKQGNFSKAREVYDRLALKHPEKSVYFAALSKALEGRSNK